MDIKDCQQAKSGDCCYCKNMAYEQIKLDYLGTKDELSLTKIELEKQKYRFKEHIGKLEAKNKELDYKLTEAYDDNYEYLEQIKELEKRLDEEMLKTTELATEIVELKAHCRGVSPLHTMVEKEIERLRAENERLKQECDLYKTWYRAKHDDVKNFLGKLKAENEELKKQVKFKNQFRDYAHKYKQCLDDIVEICTHETINLTDSCVNGGRYFEILQKIKEVKNV